MKGQISIALCLLVLAAPLPAQHTQKKPPTAWPKITKRERQRVKFCLRQLATEDSDTGEVDAAKIEQARTDLIGMGAGITLELLRQLDDQDEGKSDSIELVLDAVLAPRHSPLLARLVRRKESEVRRYVVARLAQFHAREIAPVFTEALHDRDEDVVFRAALGLGGLGKFDAMQIVFDRCRKDWHQYASLVGEVLAPMRGETAANWVYAKMTPDDISGRVAGLRLLRSLAPKSFKHRLQAELDADQHAVKKAAINTLRAVIDGDPPLKNLSVFEVIALAKKWRQR